MKNQYDVIVIGGGHAGTEAAAAAARIGVKTCIITKSCTDLGQLSCNPSIGGVAKGIIVKEIDALDGIMSKAIDQSGIHFKMLNKSKGPAVWGPRAQADRIKYQESIKNILSYYDNLDLIFQTVDDIIIESGIVKGVVCNGRKIFSISVVITSGTFLNGRIHIGEKNFAGGRLGEESITALTNKLKSYNFEIGRLKTGTPPRIIKKSINFDILKQQVGDKRPEPFSYSTKSINNKQIPCYITYTNSNTHKIISNNLQKSAIYSGNIHSVGPRYCPSIEDKIVRFKNKERHQIFLEPEGIDSNIIYPSGISTSLPEYIQEDFIRTIAGLEKARFSQYGYAIEYDFISPKELKENLESKKIKNLFFAGQINGTTGYEEAAGQGIIAGANAALKKKSKALVLSRSNSYIGVMISDLITFGTQEPYRMMTCKAEYRIKLRSDNADERLIKIADRYGLITANKKRRYNEILNKKMEVEALMKEKKINYYDIKELIYEDNINNIELKKKFLEVTKIDKNILTKIYATALYKKYEKRLLKDIAILENDKKVIIPDSVNLCLIKGLSSEIKSKIKSYCPKTIADIKRIQGMTPSALVTIMLYVKKKIGSLKDDY